MSTLELITKASVTHDSQYPITLNPDPIFLNLKPQPNDSTNPSFIKPVQGWSISQTDAQIIDSNQNFFKKLKIKLKNPNSFTKVDFITLLNLHLDDINNKAGSFIDVECPKDKGVGYTKVLVKKLGFLISGSVLDLVLEACVVFELWDVLETLVVSGLVDGSGYCKDLVFKLIEKGKADLVCLCVKHVSNLGVSDVFSVLKYFLSCGKDGFEGMVGVREEWERRAVEAIEAVKDKSVGEKKLNLAKDAAVLSVMAYDEFTSSELCLHYLVASPNVDDVMFSACVGKLNVSEVMRFMRYLKKWLVKYQKFPQAGLSSSSKEFESVPSLEHITKCFGFVVDEHFSSLVMHPEFREEVESLELVVNSLASEARLCCNLASLCAGLNV